MYENGFGVDLDLVSASVVEMTLGQLTPSVNPGNGEDSLPEEVKIISDTRSITVNRARINK